ncbi:tautomerase family protein [Carnobacterium divergens]|uniref:tautomerase family protein n=1 Tax=Carnobacterium divergens TaxID=2748 RepID=UPI001072921F|nr:tautomerase family protein [Carnobacterium divergens]TFJ46716.1 tautomerase family protein [Carnobacterium divergens]TFJ53680.1 tautomerase family protein [Carnobacterium divergens]
MPLLKFDLLEGKTEEEITKILDVTHRVVLEAFQVPRSDRYQIVTQHKAYELKMEDTGLEFDRTKNQMILTVISRKRTRKQKELFYQLLVSSLEEECQIEPRDILISFIINEDADWSFGFGKAQFLTGELS